MLLILLMSKALLKKSLAFVKAANSDGEKLEAERRERVDKVGIKRKYPTSKDSSEQHRNSSAKLTTAEGNLLLVSTNI